MPHDHSDSVALRHLEEVERPMEHKVLTQQDRRWSGKFSPENLEHTLAMRPTAAS